MPQSQSQNQSRSRSQEEVQSSLHRQDNRQDNDLGQAPAQQARQQSSKSTLADDAGERWRDWAAAQKKRAQTQPNTVGPPQTKTFWDWQLERIDNRVRNVQQGRIDSKNAADLNGDPHFLQKRNKRDPPTDRSGDYALSDTYSPKWEDRFDACREERGMKNHVSATKKMTKVQIGRVIQRMANTGALDEYMREDGRADIAKAFTATFMREVKDYICRWPRPSELALMLTGLATLNVGQSGVKDVTDGRQVDEYYYYAKIRLYNNGGRIVGRMGAYFADLTERYGLLYVWLHTDSDKKEQKSGGDTPLDLMIYSAHIPNIWSAIVDVMHRLNAINDDENIEAPTKYLTMTNEKADSFPTDRLEFRAFPKTTLYKARLDRHHNAGNNWGDDPSEREHIPMFRTGTPEQNEQSMQEYVKNAVDSMQSQLRRQAARVQRDYNDFNNSNNNNGSGYYGYYSNSEQQHNAAAPAQIDRQNEIGAGVCWAPVASADTVEARANWILDSYLQNSGAPSLDYYTMQWYAYAAYNAALYSVTTRNCMYPVLSMPPQTTQNPVYDVNHGYSDSGYSDSGYSNYGYNSDVGSNNPLYEPQDQVQAQISRRRNNGIVGGDGGGRRRGSGRAGSARKQNKERKSTKAVTTSKKAATTSKKTTTTSPKQKKTGK